jgi:hypothetical protein
MCQAGLNKSEQRHALAQVVCTFKQGRIADRGLDAQEFRASGVNLVVAAIAYWNSTYLADASTVCAGNVTRSQLSCSPTLRPSPGNTSGSLATSCGTRLLPQPGNADP